MATWNLVLISALTLAWAPPASGPSSAGGASSPDSANSAAPVGAAPAEPAGSPAPAAPAEPAASPTPAPAPVYAPPPTAAPAPVALAPVAPPNRNRGLGLMIGGFSVFGFSYLISALTGVIMIDTNKEELGRPMLVPVGGPFVAASRSQTAIGAFGFGFAGVAQLVGVGLGIGGGVMFGVSRHRASLAAAPGGLQIRF